VVSQFENIQLVKLCGFAALRLCGFAGTPALSIFNDGFPQSRKEIRKWKMPCSALLSWLCAKKPAYSRYLARPAMRS
jgi:hypothetical protein